MKYLDIISATRRVQPGADVEIHWDTETPELKEWLGYPDLQVFVDAINLYGTGAAAGQITIDRGSIQVDLHGGVLSFVVPTQILAGGYILSFSLTFTAKNQREIFRPNVDLDLVVLSSGDRPGAKAKVHSVQPNRCMIEQLKVMRKLRFELLGEDLDQGQVIGALLLGRATSNRGIPLHITERSSALIELRGSLTDQQIGWLKPGIADVVVQTEQRQLIAQVTIS